MPDYRARNACGDRPVAHLRLVPGWKARSRRALGIAPILLGPLSACENLDVGSLKSRSSRDSRQIHAMASDVRPVRTPPGNT